MIGQTPLMCAVGIHNVNIKIPFAIRFKRNLRTIRRPDRIFVSRVIVGELRQFTAILIHDIDIPIAIPI